MALVIIIIAEKPVLVSVGAGKSVVDGVTVAVQNQRWDVCIQNPLDGAMRPVIHITLLMTVPDLTSWELVDIS